MVVRLNKQGITNQIRLYKLSFPGYSFDVAVYCMKEYISMLN